MVDPAIIHESAASGTGRYPFATWRPLPEAATQGRIQPTQFIMHSESSSGGKTSNEASWNYWARADIVGEAHFLLDFDGNMVQCVDVFVRADNNAQANSRAVSIETQDNGGATVERTPWSDAQVEQLAGLVAWLSLHPKIKLPLVECPAWNAPGYGGHYLFPQWSIYKGKTCPGAARRAQIPQVIARAREIASWSPQTATRTEHQTTTTHQSQGDDDMAVGYIAGNADDRGPARFYVTGTHKRRIYNELEVERLKRRHLLRADFDLGNPDDPDLEWMSGEELQTYPTAG